jgi:hypothetical protein
LIDAGLNRLAQDGGEIIGSNRFGLAGGAIKGALVAFFGRRRRQPPLLCPNDDRSRARVCVRARVMGS